MSERSNVSIAEILGDNYYIDKLTSSDYSPSVGDTVTITLSVKDVFGDPVTGQTRTVTCTGGSFVSVNGTSITASSSVDVTTGSGGTVTLGLSVSVADNIIVSDGRCDCVVSSLSTSITNIYEASGTLTTNICFSYRTSLGTFRRVGKVVQFEMNDNVKATNKTTRGATYTYLTIPDGFKPVQSMYFQNMYWLNNEKEHQITFIAQPNGQLDARVWWINSTTQDVGLLLGATWITNDTTPSQ